MGSAIGIIANPVSARDIRRVIANATALQIHRTFDAIAEPGRRVLGCEPQRRQNADAGLLRSQVRLNLYWDAA